MTVVNRNPEFVSFPRLINVLTDFIEKKRLKHSRSFWKVDEKGDCTEEEFLPFHGSERPDNRFC